MGFLRLYLLSTSLRLFECLGNGMTEGPIQRLYRRIEIEGGLRGQTDNVDAMLGIEVNNP